MKFRQAAPNNDQCWYSEDTANLRFFGSCPTSFKATLIGHSGLVRPETRTIEADTLEFLAAGLFGEPRGGRTKWSGDSYQFGIYGITGNTENIIIIQVDGGGPSVFLVELNEARKAWAEICARLPQELLWDLCMTITGTYEKARTDMFNHLGHLFLEGRLKKRRRNGVTRMEITPKPTHTHVP